MKTINFAVELRSGRHYGVFVDDTGSPGLKTPGLDEQRKTWAAVLVPPHQIVEVMDQIPHALTALRDLGLDNPEFHFADIWAGKGEYKKLDLEQRLAIFRFMVEVFRIYGFQVLVQTFDPVNAADLRGRADWPDSFGPLKFSNHEDFALIFALLRIHMHLKTIQGGNATACVVVDEGRFASQQAIVLPGLSPTFYEGAILFASSRLVHPIQLADFAAYVLNRWQLLLVKDRLSDLDKTFLQIASPLTARFINIAPMQIQDLQSIPSLRQKMA